MRFMWKALTFAFVLFSCRSVDQSDLSSEGIVPNHLAIGDSIAFGYDPLVPMTDENVAAGMFVGYPEVAAQRLGLKVENIACSGETSSSLLDRKARNNGCHDGNEPFDQHLKVEYSANQIDYAVKFLQTHPATQLVTLTIGGNDVLLAESDCNASSLPTPCKVAKVPGVIVTLGKNISKAIDKIQGTGYKGPIVFLTQYARNYKDPVQTTALSAIQLEIQTIAKFKKIKVASGYNAFQKATVDFDGDSCKAGLMIALPEGGCNQHPSKKGRELLGQTVADLLKN